MHGKLKHPSTLEYFEHSTWRRLWIVSGGQSGTDRAALDIALELKLPARGWCPKDRLAEDGRIADCYPLQETTSQDPALRTEMNVVDSDATLILSLGTPTDGTVLTQERALALAKPLLEFDISENPSAEAQLKFRAWVEDNKIKMLNIAGPRESFRPGEIYSRSKIWLHFLLS